MNKDICDAAFNEFSISVNKHMHTVRNVASGLIYKVYKEGYEDGKKDGNADRDAAYKKGMEDMLEVIRDCILCKSVRPGCFNVTELLNAFNDGYSVTNILLLDAETLKKNAQKIYDKRKKEQENAINIGDEVRDPQTGAVFIVTDYDETCCIGGIAADGTVRFYEKKAEDPNYPVKTGRHVDIERMLKEIGEKKDGER